MRNRNRCGDRNRIRYRKQPESEKCTIPMIGTKSLSTLLYLQHSCINNMLLCQASSKHENNESQHGTGKQFAEGNRSQTNCRKRSDTAAARECRAPAVAPGYLQTTAKNRVLRSGDSLPDTRDIAGSRPSSPDSGHERHMAILQVHILYLREMFRQPHSLPLFEVRSDVLPAGAAAPLGIAACRCGHS